MMKKKDDHVAHELRDRPVPPVKGAVTDQADVILRPDGLAGQPGKVSLEDTIVFDGWL